MMVDLHGMPGTGKTAVVLELIKMLQKSHELGEMAPFQHVHLNGVLFRDNPSKVYQHLYASMSHEHRFVTSQHAQRLLQSSMERASARRVSVVLLLDEMDQITQHSVIYNLVDWSRRPHSQLIFIGISNTMDLPERLLHSRIHSRLGLARVLFPPYTHDQSISILLSRLRDCVDVVEDGAVDLIARKVAAVSGDCRRALHLCTRAIEITRMEFLENGKLDTRRMGMKHVDQALIDASMSARMLHDHIQKQPLLHRRVLAQVAKAGAQKMLAREDLVKSVLVFCPPVVSCGETIGVIGDGNDDGMDDDGYGDGGGEEQLSVKQVVGMDWREWIEQAIDRLEEQHFIALANATRQGSLSGDNGDGRGRVGLMSEVEKRGMSRVRLCIDREEVCRALRDEKDRGCIIPR
jgi:Cdc6-like AAA superfamily ATPase